MNKNKNNNVEDNIETLKQKLLDIKKAFHLKTEEIENEIKNIKSKRTVSKRRNTILKKREKKAERKEAYHTKRTTIRKKNLYTDEDINEMIVKNQINFEKQETNKLQMIIYNDPSEPALLKKIIDETVMPSNADFTKSKMFYQYHYPLRSVDSIHNAIKDVYDNMKVNFKISISFGLVFERKIQLVEGAPYNILCNLYTILY
jgi:hypothetical protein